VREVDEEADTKQRGGGTMAGEGLLPPVERGRRRKPILGLPVRAAQARRVTTPLRSLVLLAVMAGRAPAAAALMIA
jgi:hypothetical protein